MRQIWDKFAGYVLFSLFVLVASLSAAAVIGWQDWQIITTPVSNPASGYMRMWADSSSGLFKCLTSSGAVCYFNSPGSTTIHAILFSIGAPGGNVIASATNSGTVTVPFGCTIGSPSGSDWSIALGAGDTGTVTVKFWKIASGTAIPTSANVINTSGLSLSTGTLIESSTFTDFTTTTITAGDAMIMNVSTISGTISYLGVVLPCQ